MGYRSELYIMVEKNLKEEFEAILIKHDLAEHIVLHDEQDRESHYKYYGAWLKWYVGYKDVDAINEFISDNEETCALIGLGEDGAESANVGSPYELDMYFVSSIEW